MAEKMSKVDKRQFDNKIILENILTVKPKLSIEKRIECCSIREIVSIEI
jgi:hypothetical protein